MQPDHNATEVPRASPLQKTDQRTRGSHFSVNVELAKIGLRFNGRVGELRMQGFSIRVAHVSGGLFRYTLLAEPSHPRPLPKYTRRPRQIRLPLFSGGAA